ncbi:MAG: hypothetical protein U1D30_03010 [Planctomycetota bacterium]
MKAERYFILTEAAEMIPVAQRLLVEVREARSRISLLRRQRERADLSAAERSQLVRGWRHWSRKLANCLDEAFGLGILITPGIRCEAHFPFEHQWVGPAGDGKLRPAFFVYSDANGTIEDWYFDGWPNDRRAVNPAWWTMFRPGHQPTKSTQQVA